MKLRKKKKRKKAKDNMANVLLRATEKDSPFLSSIKFRIIPYLDIPRLIYKDYEMIRKHLDTRYCPQCGEYMFVPHHVERIVCHHHSWYKKRFTPLVFTRVRVYHALEVVVWERKNPRVYRFIISSKEKACGVYWRYGRRIQSRYQWTITEWNILYPHLFVSSIEKQTCLSPREIDNILFVPDLD